MTPVDREKKEKELLALLELEAKYRKTKTEVIMEVELIQKILPLDCGKTCKLVLLIMAAHLSEKQWFVKDLVEIIGGDAKTVRFALRELVDRRFVKLVGKTELQANIFELNVKEILKYQLPYLDRDTRFALERLERQAQQHHLPRSTRPKP